MAYTCVGSLFVLTLLQLCRAEISDSLPENWYSANVINDGFNPKPLSEIFHTESPPFSSTNPIIVLPKHSNSVPDELLLLSSLAPHRKISTTGSSIGDFSKTSYAALQSTTPLPPSIQTIQPSLLHTIPPSTYQSTQSTYQSTPSTYQSTPLTYQSTPSTYQSTPLTYQSTPLTYQSTPLTYQSTPSTYQSTPSTYLTTPSTLAAFSPLTTPKPIITQPQFEIQPTTLTQSQTQSSQSQSQQIRLELVPQNQNRPEPSTPGPLSNYFVIYQQAPQSIGGFPDVVSTISPVSTTREPSTVIIQPLPSVSPPSTRTSPPSSTYTSPPSSTTFRVQTTPIPRTRFTQTVSKVATTSIPRLPGKVPLPLKIRVVAPSGSITNVHFIEPKPILRPTTKKPTTYRTRKTQKPKKNTYDSCTDGCKGKREPICAAPLSSDFLDSNTLKGFPSVCHMACHNSYKKDAYEKVLDGRCSRMRTRIRTLDCKTKLKRDELNKAQYFLDNSGTKTVVEFSGLRP